MATDKEVQAFGGCILAMMHLIVVLPLWYALLFGLLDRVEAPTWMWICYFTYMPAGFAIASAKAFFDKLFE